MISVISVDYHSGAFKEIQEHSLARYADPEIPYELLIQDNGIDNVGHGYGIEQLIAKAKYNIILVLDIDAHIILPNWNRELIDLASREWDKGVRLVAGQGGLLKPVRPCVMMFERDYFLENKMTFQAHQYMGAKFDVGVLFAFQVLSRGDRVQQFIYGQSTYPNTIGNNYMIATAGKEKYKHLVYHHWYGTRWYNGNGEVVKNKIDNLTWAKFKQSRDELIKQYYGESNSNSNNISKARVH